MKYRRVLLLYGFLFPYAVMASFPAVASAAEHDSSLLREAMESPSFQSSLKLAITEKDANNPLYGGNFYLATEKDVKSNSVLFKESQTEFDRAWKWWRIIFRNQLLPEFSSSNVIGVKGAIGLRKDDVITSSFTTGAYRVGVIDGRSVSVVVMPIVDKKPIATDEAAVKKEIGKVFHHLFWYDKGYEPFNIPYLVDVLSHRTSRSFGYITVKNTSWIENGGITWWSDSHIMVFDVKKYRHVPNSKVYKAHWYEDYIFGLTPDDPQTFHRFGEFAPIDFQLALDRMRSNPLVNKFANKPTIREDTSKPVSPPSNEGTGRTPLEKLK